MKIDNLLSRLDKVKKTGGDSWIACCPAHKDRSPSMTLREDPDGRILIHCFAECEPLAILEAVGLSFSDLFPEKLGSNFKPLRRPFPAADVLEALSTETLIVYITADRLAKGLEIYPGELARVELASQRILAGRDLANG